MGDSQLEVDACSPDAAETDDEVFQLRSQLEECRRALGEREEELALAGEYGCALLAENARLAADLVALDAQRHTDHTFPSQEALHERTAPSQIPFPPPPPQLRELHSAQSPTTPTSPLAKPYPPRKAKTFSTPASSFFDDHDPWITSSNENVPRPQPRLKKRTSIPYHTAASTEKECDTFVELEGEHDPDEAPSRPCTCRYHSGSARTRQAERHIAYLESELTRLQEELRDSRKETAKWRREARLSTRERSDLGVEWRVKEEGEGDERNLEEEGEEEGNEGNEMEFVDWTNESIPDQLEGDIKHLELSDSKNRDRDDDDTLRLVTPLEFSDDAATPEFRLLPIGDETSTYTDQTPSLASTNLYDTSDPPGHTLASELELAAKKASKAARAVRLAAMQATWEENHTSTRPQLARSVQQLTTRHGQSDDTVASAPSLYPTRFTPPMQLESPSYASRVLQAEAKQRSRSASLLVILVRLVSAATALSWWGAWRVVGVVAPSLVGRRSGR
ncbi:hypothetical protein M427DRAFT_29673 [Gonapodya prolifera JEL478]|uniref:Uncharacterized protein n=1 Tax=Gonapodya prolifera (strain JEL478) TaxID=1344416 RepID=A0A139ANK4_GONPJ|nr:hypothetical protein M427DRAFT_29673 [Gonapodya prolifera JEL478]|eukprot:KXS18320.1 hypothetical protein M427DRAFT_29673 [Gonapodya prolifera JEL478]